MDWSRFVCVTYPFTDIPCPLGCSPPTMGTYSPQTLEMCGEGRRNCLFYRSLPLHEQWKRILWTIHIYTKVQMGRRSFCVATIAHKTQQGVSSHWCADLYPFSHALQVGVIVAHPTWSNSKDNRPTESILPDSHYIAIGCREDRRSTRGEDVCSLMCPPFRPGSTPGVGDLGQRYVIYWHRYFTDRFLRVQPSDFYRQRDLKYQLFGVQPNRFLIDLIIKIAIHPRIDRHQKSAPLNTSLAVFRIDRLSSTDCIDYSYVKLVGFFQSLTCAGFISAKVWGFR